MRTSAEVIYRLIDSPIGPLMLTGEAAAPAVLCGLFMNAHLRGPRPGADWRCDDTAHQAAAEQLAAYFAGELRSFDLRLDLRGTEFQRRVWQVLRGIDFGQTRTYADVAAAIGAPRAVRAVGAAVGRNPVSIIVPCHRVVGSNGSLTGFGGGLERKEWLLEHEGVGTRSLWGKSSSLRRGKPSLALGG